MGIYAGYIQYKYTFSHNAVHSSVYVSFLMVCVQTAQDASDNDSSLQCLTSSRDKTHEKKFGGQNLGQTAQNWT